VSAEHGRRTSESLRLPKNRHIKQNRDFARVRAQGKRMARGCLTANWLDLPLGSTSRVGVVTSRKIGSAVVRSRARRLLREAFRLHQGELNPVDLVLVARQSIVGKTFADVERDFLGVMRQAGVLRISG
jgi:ribonuclease P protein component